MVEGYGGRRVWEGRTEKIKKIDEEEMTREWRWRGNNNGARSEWSESKEWRD